MTEPTARCPHRPDPAPLPPIERLRGDVQADRCPISGRPLTPLNAAVGVTADNRPVEDTRGRCPSPCDTMWWVDPDGTPVYAGPELRVDLPWPDDSGDAA